MGDQRARVMRVEVSCLWGNGKRGVILVVKCVVCDRKGRASR